jgi:hypothetical protein
LRLTELDLDNNPFGLPGNVIVAIRDAGIHESLWPVASKAGRVVLHITDYGIRIYDGSKNSLVEWSDTFELAATADGLAFLSGRYKELSRFTYLNNVHSVEVQDAIHRAGGNVPRVKHVVTAEGRTALAPEPRSGRSPGPRITDAPTAATDARGTLLGLFWGGLIFAIIGTVIVLAAYPGTRRSDDTGDLVDTGNTALAIIGSVISSAGYGMVLVALIGWAVMLGVRAAKE